MRIDSGKPQILERRHAQDGGDLVGGVSGGHVATMDFVEKFAEFGTVHDVGCELRFSRDPAV